TNLLLHIFTSLGVFYLLIALGFERGYSLAGALVYAVHYLSSHAVIWIPARGDLLLALFSVLSMLTFIRLMETKKTKYLALNTVCFALALFSKETAVILPVLSALYAWFYHRESIKSTSAIMPLVLAIPSGILYAVLRKSSIVANSQALGVQAIFANLPTIPETVAKLIVPIKYSTMPFFDLTTTLIGLGIIIGVAVLWMNGNEKRSPLALFGFSWFALFLIPSMLYRPDFSSYHYEYLDHRVYLPAIGFLIAVMALVRSLNMARVGIAVFVLVFSVNAVANMSLHTGYASPLSFAETALHPDSRSSLAHFLRGNQMYQRGDSLGAMRDFTAALDRYPQFHEARYNRALLRQRAKDMKGALEDLDVLLRDKPDYGSSAWETRAIVRASLSDGKGANEDFQQALRLDPQNPKIQRNYSVFKSTLTVDPDALAESDRLSEQGIQLAQKGQLKEALSLFQRAAELNPKDLRSKVNIGNCLHAMGDLPGACRSWKQAAAGGNRYAQTMMDRFCN
ncbi:MAG: tetratricopeptide repeat protein, partial [Candidatus Kapaibacterium sp.]